MRLGMEEGVLTRQRVPRTPGSLPPCWKCPKSGPQNGKPAPENEISLKNLRALDLYWRIKAGMPMPDDAIVRRNCGLIEMVLARINAQRTDVQGLLAFLFTSSKKG
ncbi:MAG TPA: hypothetical protein VMG10_31005 [Gemmataceae bacterium]|nr:hypothetical protein [Gemmataceae bacterium]